MELNKMIELDGKMISLDSLIDTFYKFNDLEEKSKKYNTKRDAEKALKPYQAELIKLQQCLESKNQKMIILFEGRDAAGKGGTIRRVTRYMDEKHYRIVALGKPTQEQQSQWFYQKYIQHFPRGGEIVLFDRSWYNRAMVENVFNFCTQKEYDDFMSSVTAFENDLTNQGTVLVKLYYSVTKDEQASRFERRKNDPLRQWKLSEIDMQAQEKWDDFTTTKYNMIKQTHTHNAPWTIIRSDDKQKARMESLKVILNSIDYDNKDKSLDFCVDSDVVISGAREIEIMDSQRIINDGKFIG